MRNDMSAGYSYNDIYLTPRYSELKSRSEADISVEFLGRKFKAPWIPANMQSVINIDNCKWLSENDYFYIYHRFGDTKAFIEKANKENWKIISISIGVKESDYDLIRWYFNTSNIKVDYITLDTAHAHSVLTKNMIGYIKSYNASTKIPKIIAGNVCTPEAVRDLASWGADAVKVGIAGGGACSTKNMTGFHIPMFSCIRDCFGWGNLGNSKKSCYRNEDGSPQEIYNAKIPIIGDGGIRENGDIAKALSAGAMMVMAGSIFAACIDAPGENIYETVMTNGYFINENGMGDTGVCKREKIVKKRYYGSASAKQKGEKKNIEGFEVEIPCNGLTYSEKYKELTESLQSSVSYGGGKDLSCLKSVRYIVVK